ncbi:MULTISPECIES: hypothetical protein [Flammeovirga]|uniref:HPt domain-containing protein n=1 Tax=Flammeovirga agarivorans TaxID=2726742 RepID=A0A7X8SL93_9BACT|nr:MULTISPECIES: hypothetical protein [Flammeovirga]NLR92319.1 hypothetical protein [Flammeovirga agarivorans]
MSTTQNMRMFDTTQLEALSRGDNSFVIKMIESFKTNLVEGIDEINDAKSYNDWLTIGKVAHRLKPSFQILNVTSMADIVLSLEKDFKKTDFSEEEHEQLIAKFLADSKILLGQIQTFLHN